MNDLQPLIALLGQTEGERDRALALSQQLDAESRHAQAQAEQLLAYRGDYEKRWSQHFGREGKIELVHCYQGFTGRLNQAIEQQEHATRGAASRAAEAAVALREHEIRVASVRKLIERRVQELRRAADVREQKQSDEFAARLAWQRLSNFGSLSAR